MALVANFNLELHQMDVKTAFLNGELVVDVYMIQPEDFIEAGKKKLVCKLRNPSLKQASRQWYLKFDQVIASFGFNVNASDQCIYLNTNERDFIILVLYVDDILLASNNVNLLNETRLMLNNHFGMNNLGDASDVLGIQIFRDREIGVLGLSQK